MIFLSSNLKFIRALANLTLNELSIQTELSVSALASYEDRAVTPKMESLLHLLQFYNDKFNAGLTLDDLITKDLTKIGFNLPEGTQKKEVESSESNIKNSDEDKSELELYHKKEIEHLNEIIRLLKENIVDLKRDKLELRHVLDYLRSKI